MICSVASCNVVDMANQPDLDSAFGRLRWAREKAGFKSAADFAAAVRIPAVTYRAYENGQNGYFKHAPDFAAKLGVSSEWLMRGGPAPDVQPNHLVRTEVRGTGMTPDQIRAARSGRDLPSLKLVGSAMGGDFDGLEDVEMHELCMGDVLDNLPRPASVAQDEEAYAVEIMGESMAPRYEPGERVAVSPRAPVRIGDDVIVQLTNTSTEEGSDTAGQVTMVLIKRLVRRGSDFIELLQFNPERTFRVPKDRARRIHRVMRGL